MHPYSELPLVLVSGLGRSGTTVLRNCVAAHPDIDARNAESNYIFSLMRNANLASEDQNIANNLALKFAKFWEHHRELVLQLCWPKPANDQNPPRAIATYSKLDPRAAMGLSETFDRLTILYALRNGIEVVSSFQSFEPFQHLAFEDVCRLWSTRYDMFQYCRDNQHATLIRYEWITDDHETLQLAVEQSLQSVGLGFHPDCLKPLSKTYHPTRFEGESRQDARDSSKRKERWRLWTDRQRSVFEEICGPVMKDLKYLIPWESNDT